MMDDLFMFRVTITALRFTASTATFLMLRESSLIEITRFR